MQTASRLLISFGVIFGLLAALAFWTEWGRLEFKPDADAAGYALLFGAVCCMLLGVVVHALSKTGASPDEPSDDVAEDVDPGTPLCPHCLAPTEMVQVSCDICGAPLTSQAGIDPVQQFRTMGGTLGQAAANPKSKIVLIGMWVFFIVPIVNCIIVLTLVLNRPPEFTIGSGSRLVEFGETP